MLSKFINSFLDKKSPMTVHAHCDGPCGVYDPASTRVAAEAVLSMTKKLIALEAPSSTDSVEWAAYSNTFSRYVAVKEEQAKEAKELPLRRSNGGCGTAAAVHEKDLHWPANA